MRLSLPISLLALALCWGEFNNAAPPSLPRAEGKEACGLIAIADGFGGYFATVGIRSAVEATGAPFKIITDPDTTVPGVVIEPTHGATQRCASKRILDSVLAWRRAHPSSRIVMVGYSAGTAVTLRAAAQLPPNTVNRIILLAPLASPDYDLSSALRASREGIDAFYSEHDEVLHLAIPHLRTSDGKRAPSSGQVGFRVPAGNPLYRKLRQYGYREEYGAYGHCGGHFGWVRPRFVCAFILPLIVGPTPG